MKKALFVIDHKDRDLKGVVLIAYELFTKHKIMPFFTTTRNEISSLIKYEPNVIFIQHVRHDWQEEFLKYAKSKNIKVALSLAEGFPRAPHETLFSVGQPRLFKYLDLIMTWGKKLSENCDTTILPSHTRLIHTGSPRFDFHTKKFQDLNLSRKDVFNRLQFPDNQPLVLWMTNYKYANRPGGINKILESVRTPGSSDHRIAATIEPKVKDHQRCFDFIKNLFIKLLEKGPQINLLIKVHPSESKEVYESIFSSFPNVRVIHDLDNLTLTDIIVNSDLQVNWRCTTASEAWMRDINKKVISIDVPGLELNEFEYLKAGCDIVGNFEEFEKVIKQYINGAPVPENIVRERIEFIQDYLYSNDGNSAVRCAEEIYYLINIETPKKFSLIASQIFFKKLKSYRFRRNWVALKRGPEHPKYISPNKIHEEIKLLEPHFKKIMEYKYL